MTHPDAPMVVMERFPTISWGNMAQFSILRYGPKGIMFAGNGPGMYYYVCRDLLKIFSIGPFRVMEGYFVEAHARLISRTLKDRAVVNVGAPEIDPGYHPDDRAYCWVSVELK